MYAGQILENENEREADKRGKIVMHDELRKKRMIVMVRNDDIETETADCNDDGDYYADWYAAAVAVVVMLHMVSTVD